MQNTEFLRERSPEQVANVARKPPATNERNKNGGLVFNNNTRGTTTVEECDTDTDQQQHNLMNKLH